MTAEPEDAASPAPLSCTVAIPDGPEITVTADQRIPPGWAVVISASAVAVAPLTGGEPAVLPADVAAHFRVATRPR